MSTFYPVRMTKAFAIYEFFDEGTETRLPGYKVLVWTNNPEVAALHLSKIDLRSVPWHRHATVEAAKARVLSWVREERAYTERALEGRKDVLHNMQRDIETFEKELVAYGEVEKDLVPPEEA